MEDRYGCLVDKVNRMKGLDPVILELLTALKNNDSKVADLEAIIETDANTSATILKIANSPFYGLSRQIHSIQDACVLLGYDQMRNVIYASALDQLTSRSSHPLWQQQLKLHTQVTAIIARYLARERNVSPADSYASGLLHALGKQVVLAEFPEEFVAYMEDTTQEHHRGFLKLFSVIGQMVAENWYLPEVLNAAICCHRKPRCAAAEHQPLVKLVSEANNLASGLGYSSPGEVVKPVKTTIDDSAVCAIKEHVIEILASHET